MRRGARSTVPAQGNATFVIVRGSSRRVLVKEQWLVLQCGQGLCHGVCACVVGILCQACFFLTDALFLAELRSLEFCTRKYSARASNAAVETSTSRPVNLADSPGCCLRRTLDPRNTKLAASKEVCVIYAEISNMRSSARNQDFYSQPLAPPPPGALFGGLN